jgi:hypothetical protein
MAAKSGNGSGRREALALVLAAGGTVRAAAAKAKVSERTARNWLAEDAFRARVEQLRAAILERTMSMTIKASTKAAATLARLLDSKDDRVKLGAARAILEQAVVLREKVSVEQRVAALEAEVRRLK